MRFTKYTPLIMAFFLMTIAVVHAQEAEPLYQEVVRVTALGTLNVRDEASTGNPAIATFSVGETVTVLEQIPEGETVNGNSLWYRIALNDGGEGFVWSGAVGELQIERTCLRFIPSEPNNIWIAVRERSMPLLVWDAEYRRLVAQGNTGDEPLLWAVMVPPDGVSALNGFAETVTVTPVIDTETCQEVGTLVDNNGFPHYAVKQSPNSPDVKFINATYVTETRRATGEETAIILQLVDAQEEAESNMLALEAASQELRLGGKITFVGVVPETRQNDPYGQGLHRIYLLSLDGSMLQTLSSDSLGQSASNEFNPSWSPDGKTVAFVLYRGGAVGLQFFDLVSGRRRGVAEQPPYYIHKTTWSPSGDQLAVVRWSRIVRQEWDNGDIGIIPQSFDRLGPDTVDILTSAFQPTEGNGIPRYAIGSLDWSPDGAALAFAYPESDDLDWGIYYYSFGEGAFHRVGDGEKVEWSPDSSRLLITDAVGTTIQSAVTRYYIASLDGLNPRYLNENPTRLVAEFEPRWAPSGDQIAYQMQSEGEGISSLFVYDLAADSSQRFTTGLEMRGVAWSPDSTQLVFVGRQPNATNEYEAIYIINADGSNQHMLVDGIDYYSDLLWLPAIEQ